ncbi:MAG: J domain-containing protein [Acidimicrobiales bacterium]
MAIRYWKRMREEGAKHPDPAARQGENPWVDPNLAGPAPLPTIDLDALTRDEVPVEERAAMYSDWAERMRAKRVNAQRTIAERQAETTGARPAEEEAPSYWRTDSVFATAGDEHAPGDRPNPWRVQELLEVLDLREGATRDDVSRAYRDLAKQHHPDRFADADDEVRRFHEARMAKINTAYSALRQLELA